MYILNCIFFDEVIIIVMNELSILGFFFLNGDGYNDNWIIKGIDMYLNV